MIVLAHQGTVLVRQIQQHSERREIVKQVFVVIAALAAGFVGGILGTHWIPIRPSPEQVIRARAFELVDGAGNVISFWGIDKGEHTVLAFASQGVNPKVGGRAQRVDFRPDDPIGQLASVGEADDMPFVRFKGEDGRDRMNLVISMTGKPLLLMGDEDGPRVGLGIRQSDTPGPQDNDWALEFGPERASIGMTGRRTQDGVRYFRGFSFVNEDMAK
jgi:hypothetical protein